MVSLPFGGGSGEFSSETDVLSTRERDSASAGLFKMEFLKSNALRATEKGGSLRAADLPSLELASATSPPRSESALTGQQMQALRRELVESEGVRNSVYFDSRGIRTVGIGFNLERADAPTRLKEVGADFQKIFNGSQKLNGQQIEQLFKFTLKEAIDGAVRLFPDLPKYSYNVKKVLVDMVFNMGVDQVGEFKTFGKAIREGRYWDAGHSLRDTLYYQQVGRRAVRNEFLLKGAGR